EQRLAEAISSLGLDALASAVPLNVDLDVVLLVLATHPLQRRRRSHRPATTTCGEDRGPFLLGAAQGDRLSVIQLMTLCETGTRAPIARRFILSTQARLQAVSATLTDRQPSKATVWCRPNIAPGVRGQASGPAITSNRARNRAVPERGRRPRSALSDD